MRVMNVHSVQCVVCAGSSNEWVSGIIHTVKDMM